MRGHNSIHGTIASCDQIKSVETMPKSSSSNQETGRGSHDAVELNRSHDPNEFRPIYILKQRAGLALDITAGVSLFKEIESMKETGKVVALVPQ